MELQRVLRWEGVEQRQMDVPLLLERRPSEPAGVAADVAGSLSAVFHSRSAER